MRNIADSGTPCIHVVTMYPQLSNEISRRDVLVVPYISSNFWVTTSSGLLRPNHSGFVPPNMHLYKYIISKPCTNSNFYPDELLVTCKHVLYVSQLLSVKGLVAGDGRP